MRIAIGTDTGGSTRVPAAYCGVVGLKPTYGLLSTSGLFPLAPSLDHCAPLAAQCVSDMALMLNVIAGFDPRDPASVDRPPEDYTRHLGQDIKGMRLGYARAFLVEGDILPELLTSLDDAVGKLQDLGAIVEEVRIPDFDLFRACSKVIVAAEAFAVHERNLRSRPRDYGLLTYARLVAGVGVTAADLVHAVRVRRKLVEAVRAILSRYDALMNIDCLGRGAAARPDGQEQASADGRFSDHHRQPHRSSRHLGADRPLRSGAALRHADFRPSLRRGAGPSDRSGARGAPSRFTDMRSGTAPGRATAILQKFRRAMPQEPAP